MKDEMERKQDQLLRELKQIGNFRRGSVNQVLKKCGKPKCACNRDDHPGHGPMNTLTYCDQGKKKTKSLPNAAAVKLVSKQVENHERFIEWSKKWVKLNEEISDSKLVDILSGNEVEMTLQEKKRRSTSSRKSGGKSKA